MHSAYIRKPYLIEGGAMHMRFCFGEHFKRFHGFFPAARQPCRRLDEVLDGLEVARRPMRGGCCTAATIAVAVRVVVPTTAAAAVAMGMIVAAAANAVVVDVLVLVRVASIRRCCLTRREFSGVFKHRVHVHFGGSNLAIGPHHSFRSQLPFPRDARHGA